MGGGYEQTLLQRSNSDGQQAHEKMLHIANYQKMQIKTTMRYHFTPVRMTSIEKTKKNMLARMRRKGNPPTLLVGM